MFQNSLVSLLAPSMQIARVVVVDTLLIARLS